MCVCSGAHVCICIGDILELMCVALELMCVALELGYTK